MISKLSNFDGTIKKWNPWNNIIKINNMKMHKMHKLKPYSSNYNLIYYFVILIQFW